MVTTTSRKTAVSSAGPPGPALLRLRVQPRVDEPTTFSAIGNWNMTGWTTDDKVDELLVSPTDTYGYHPSGALKRQPAIGTAVETFGYNDQNLLSTKANMQQSWLSLMYWDQAERRIKLETSGGDTWHFIYDPTASVPAVLAEIKNGSVEAFYVRDPNGQLLARVAGETRQYYFFDGLGSTQAIAPAVEGNPTDRYFYTPWGEEDSRQQSLSGTSGNPYRYVGQLGYYHHHQDQNLADWMQLGVRFYNPEIGRFERRDPVERWEEGAYVYGGGTPTRMVDSSGRVLTAKQCDKISEILEFERRYGTPLAACMYSNTWGPRKMGIDDFSDQPIQTAWGVIDLDWFTDLRCAMGVTRTRCGCPDGLYMFGKSYWNTIRGWYRQPYAFLYEDPKERIAVYALRSGACTFRQLFPPGFMKLHCTFWRVPRGA